MKTYIIITANNESDLMRFVNKRIDEGYSCQGGVSVSQVMTNNYQNTIYAQAMIYSPYVVSTLEEMQLPTIQFVGPVYGEQVK